MRRASKAWVGYLVAAVAACSGGGSGNDGAAGAENGGVCDQGETRLCFGPAACAGAQFCGDDGRWQGCDCGSGPATGGASGAAGSEATDSGGASNAGTGSTGSGDAGSGNTGSGDAGTGNGAGEGGTPAVENDCPGIDACHGEPECSTRIDLECPRCDHGPFACGSIQGYFGTDGSAFPCEQTSAGLDCTDAANAIHEQCCAPQ